MLVELNVINGKDDGSFDPGGIVTRAEMAKMICVVLNGGSDPNLGQRVQLHLHRHGGPLGCCVHRVLHHLGIVAGDGTGSSTPPTP